MDIEQYKILQQVKIKIGTKKIIIKEEKTNSNYLNIPNVPNFNKRPAKTIEPSTGASTCASGN